MRPLFDGRQIFIVLIIFLELGQMPTMTLNVPFSFIKHSYGQVRELSLGHGATEDFREFENV
jgi:hypothetical protein